MTDYLDAAIEAARAAGKLLCENFHEKLRVDAVFKHDIKLEIDVRTQTLITNHLLTRFPQHALYGEEGIVGDQSAEFQWIVDPLDGTVNYFYGIPHFCTSIALRRGDEVVIGVIYDPLRDEIWAGRRGEPPTLNGAPFRVSQRTELGDAMISVGLSKTGQTIREGMPLLQDMVQRVRKCRLLGSAALDMAYVACGRFDAYIEQGISLWDIAAGWLLIEEAGGSVKLEPRFDMKDKYMVMASSGRIDFGIR